MPRRLLSLLAFLLLLLSAQAAADGHREGGHGKAKDAGKHKDDRQHGGSDGDGEDGEDGVGWHGWKGWDGERGERKGDRRDRRDHQARDEDRRDGAGDRRVAGDAGVRIIPTVLPGRVGFTLLVTTTASFETVTLTAGLPDVEGPWTASGPGAGACDLTGTDLSCSFKGPAAGAIQTVHLSAPARSSPWELVADATVATGEGADAVPGNDEASARIGLLLS